jgi:ethanolamine utilization microcompartment shell protein EutS
MRLRIVAGNPATGAGACPIGTAERLSGAVIPVGGEVCVQSIW